MEEIQGLSVGAPTRQPPALGGNLPALAPGRERLDIDFERARLVALVGDVAPVRRQDVDWTRIGGVRLPASLDPETAIPSRTQAPDRRKLREEAHVLDRSPARFHHRPQHRFRVG